MVQEFAPSTSAYKGRQRLTGVSERETIRRLQGLMLAANQRHSDPSAPGYFTPADLALVAEAIEATVCHYNPRMRLLYQPSLDRMNPPLPLAARLLALADLGGLAMEGLESYREEGCLLFLEDNPDVIVLIQGQVAPQSCRNMRAAQENLRQRLLGWSRFQVDFARGRLVRRDQELGALPAASVSWIRQMLFRHLDEAMIAHIEATAPVAEDVSLATLLQFFKFESYL